MNALVAAAQALPADADRALLVGRAWVPSLNGPLPVVVRDGVVHDLSGVADTCSDLLALESPAAAVRSASRTAPLGAVDDLLRNSVPLLRDERQPWLLAPCDLQPVKASGVTFVASLLERVIEEQARGDAARAEGLRTSIRAVIGDSLHDIRPGSPDAMRLKDILIGQGVWSQYLEVGIGPDAEIFTKCPPLAAVGTGADVGIHPRSEWNNPEPEIVLAVSPAGVVVGAALGNDVNLRDFEGRSALLLGKAKDNNASCAIGPFIRLFDDGFSLDDVRQCELALQMRGEEGFEFTARSSMAEISRDPLEIVEHTIGPHHQYPDGVMLFLGTMFAPTIDRAAPGKGFTHRVGDIVSVATPALGTLINRVEHTDRIPPWTFGIRALMASLRRRSLAS